MSNWNKWYGRETKTPELNRAFALMRKRGIIARQSFSCCSSCGGYELASLVSDFPKEKRDRVKGVCFYHKQAAASGREGWSIFLQFGPLDTLAHGLIGLDTCEVGKIVLECLREANVDSAWDGTENQCIEVVGPRTRQERQATAN